MCFALELCQVGLNRLRPGCFFIVVAPFCSCPASLVSRKFFAVGPGCAKCLFFCCAPLGAATFRRGQSKIKNTTQGVFFFAPAPCRRPTGLLLPLPFAGAGKKKHPGWCFFCSGPVPAPNGASPSRAFRRGRSKKTKYPGWCLFFLLRPRADAHSLTAGLGGDASPSAGWCFFFCCGPARTGVVFFFLLWPRPDAHSLTVGWGDFGKARVVFFFFAAAPPGLFRQ